MKNKDEKQDRECFKNMSESSRGPPQTHFCALPLYSISPASTSSREGSVTSVQATDGATPRPIWRALIYRPVAARAAGIHSDCLGLAFRFSGPRKDERRRSGKVSGDLSVTLRIPTRVTSISHVWRVKVRNADRRHDVRSMQFAARLQWESMGESFWLKYINSQRQIWLTVDKSRERSRQEKVEAAAGGEARFGCDRGDALNLGCQSHFSSGADRLDTDRVRDSTITPSSDWQRQLRHKYKIKEQKGFPEIKFSRIKASNSQMTSGIKPTLTGSTVRAISVKNNPL